MSVGPRRKSAFLLSYLTHCFLLFCTVFFLPGCPCSAGCFPHPSTTTRLPAQSQVPETAPLLKSSESPPQTWQVLCWSDSQIPGVTLFSRPVPHTFWYTYGIRTAFFVQHDAAHAALRTVAVDIKSRGRCKSKRNVPVTPHEVVLVIMSDEYRQHFPTLRKRLKFPGIDIRHRRRLQKNISGAAGFSQLIIFVLMCPISAHRTFFPHGQQALTPHNIRASGYAEIRWTAHTFHFSPEGLPAVCGTTQ